MNIKCTCGKLLDRNDMGITSHLRGKDHLDDPDVRFQEGEHKGKIKKKGIKIKRYAMKYSDTSLLNEPAKTQKEKALLKTTGLK